MHKTVAGAMLGNCCNECGRCQPASLHQQHTKKTTMLSTNQWRNTPLPTTQGPPTCRHNPMILQHITSSLLPAHPLEHWYCCQNGSCHQACFAAPTPTWVDGQHYDCDGCNCQGDSLTARAVTPFTASSGGRHPSAIGGDNRSIAICVMPPWQPALHLLAVLLLACLPLLPWAAVGRRASGSSS